MGMKKMVMNEFKRKANQKSPLMQFLKRSKRMMKKCGASAPKDAD